MNSITWGTKAETLGRLASVLTSARIQPQVTFDVREWRASRDSVLARLRHWFELPLAVRSSARLEDRGGQSLAGHFRSVLNAAGQESTILAIEQVLASFEPAGDDDQVLVQPMVANVGMSGVVFTRDAGTGSPYFVVSYDETSGLTDSVTSGRADGIRTFYAFRDAPTPAGSRFTPVLNLARELMSLLACDALDIEFAVATDGTVYLLQVRPLVMADGPRSSPAQVAEMLSRIERKVSEGQAPHPYLFGTRTVYGVMPDWNPAEIIGIRPRPLALSLYKDVITDSVWAYQRNNYGYKNLRSFPLLISLGGLPYIDVRVSFNSFLPADVEPGLSERLINYYVDALVSSPSHHDKVEFEIVYSCYTFDLPARLERLTAAGFDARDCEALSQSLRALTNTIIHPESGLWLKDIEKIRQLEARRARVADVADPLARIYWLIEDCKRYGTLPFVGLARAAFIAVQLLRSLVAVGVLTPDDHRRFMASLSTVGSRLAADFRLLGREEFLARYGHLRPGTYDVMSPRYDEQPDRYFDWDRVAAAAPVTEPPFALSIDQLNQTRALLERHQLGNDAIGFFNFIKSAIEGREYAKFIFTQSLSDALQQLKELAEAHGLSDDDCSYIDYSTVQQLYASSADPGEVLARSAAGGRTAYAMTQQLVLPPLLVQPADVWAFEVPPTDPNFVTIGVAEGPVRFADSPREGLTGCILFIPSADPGFDWIFAHPIRGFVTMWGGANSHMAVRAAELGIPAVIGAGESSYTNWARAEVLHVDCANRQVRVIR